MPDPRLVAYTPPSAAEPSYLAPWLILQTAADALGGTAITLTVRDFGDPPAFAVIHATEDVDTINARWLEANQPAG